jgi:phosphoribosylglycinamide formyltransferase-1
VTSRLKVGVLISGRGSNLQALIDACAAPDFPARVVLVISNIAEAYGLKRAEAARIPHLTVAHRDYASRADFDAAVTAQLEQAGVELVCLAGFMRILSDAFVTHWQGRMINIHPSLLPAYKGTQVHERVIADGAPVSGCTVHYVTPELDSGPVILQAQVPVLANDTPDTLAARVLEQEHVIYPRALKLIAERKVRLENGRAVFA